MSDPAVAIDSSIGTLAGLASELGPFLFSILFLIVITGTAYRWYGNTVAQQPPDPSMLRVCRVWFVVSFSVGLLCTGLSIAWWFHQHLIKTYVYQVTVQGVPWHQDISSAYYIRSVPEAINMRPGDARIEDMKWDKQLLIIQNTEFSKNQKFQLETLRYPEPQPNCLAGEPTSVFLDFEYAGNPEDAYELEWQPDGHPKLKPLSVATQLAGTSR